MRALPILIVCLLPALSWASSIQQLQSELEQQQYARAATTGLAMLRQQPDNVQVLFLTAVAFQHNQQPEQATRYYRHIVKLQPNLPEPLNNLAMIQMQQGNHDQAVDLLIASLKTHPSYATAWRNLSNLYRGLASEAYRRALSEDSDPSAVMDDIRLVALDNLHSLPPATTLAARQAPVIRIARSDPQPQSAPVADQSMAQLAPVKTATTDQQLMEIIRNWARAWSDKDFDTYIKAYADDYKGRQANHRAWVDYRRSRILRPGSISVKVDNLSVKSRSEDRAIIDFHQAFKSPTYRDKIVKRIVLTKLNGRWLITRETTLSVL